jgi:hypothetical protein
MSIFLVYLEGREAYEPEGSVRLPVFNTFSTLENAIKFCNQNYIKEKENTWRGYFGGNVSIFETTLDSFDRFKQAKLLN